MPIVSVIIPMYNASAHIIETLNGVRAQQIPKPWRLEIVVVDDCSTDHSVQMVKMVPDKRIQLITRPRNGGRASARNLGYRSAQGTLCLFLDADCVYLHQDTVALFIASFSRGVEACFGAVTALGDGFWERYQRDNYERRKRDGNILGFITTANFGVKRSLLKRAGGFDERYLKYGFEDRDLFHSLKKQTPAGHIRIVPPLLVRHLDRLTLDDVCDKMFEAGRYSAVLFREKHPLAYQQTSFGRCDLSLMPPKRARLIEVCLRPRPLFKSLVALIIKTPEIPYRLKYFAVKVLSAVFFMAGTAEN